MKRTRHGLEPVTAHDADMLAEYALGSDCEVSIKKRRSLPQLRLYWSTLHNVVAATGSHPSAEHLHDAIKMDLGYTTPIKRLNGTIEYVPDSVAFGKMDAAQFKAFFDAAMKQLAEVYGIDPLAIERAA